MGLPLFSVARPPMEDLPQHVAIVAVLANPAASPDLVADFGRTPHVAWYALAVSLAWLVGPLLGTKLLLSASLSAIPLTLRLLTARLGGDPRAAWLGLPLVWTGFVAYGFVQFVAGVPLLLLALALAAPDRPLGRREHLRLAAILLLTFSMHLLCAGVAGVGVLALRAGREGKQAWRSLLMPLVVGLIALGWLALTDAGADLLAMLGVGHGSVAAAAPARFRPPAEVIPEALNWLSNLTHTHHDDQAFWLWGVVLLGCVLAAERSTRLPWSWVAFVVLVALVALVAPHTVGWIWPLGDRFAWLALLLVVASVSLPRGEWAAVAVAACLTATAVRIGDTSAAYRAVEREEQAGLDAVIRAVPVGTRLCGVMHDSHSAHVPWWPHHYSAAWVQAERGGSLVFSFVEHPSTPLRVRPGVAPPPTGPTGFRPQQASSQHMRWCEHVLVYQGPGAFGAPRAHVQVAQHGRFRLYARRAWVPRKLPADGPGRRHPGTP